MKTKRLLCGVLASCMLFCTACNKNDGTETEETSATETTIVTPNILPLTFLNTSKSGGSFIYDILYTDADMISLTNEDIVLPEGLKADVYVAEDALDADVRSILLSNIEAETGTYKVCIKEGTALLGEYQAPSYEFDVVIGSPNISQYIKMSCATSATEIESGDALSIYAQYSGTTDSKYLDVKMSEEFIQLYNCTGNLSFSKANNGLASCIVFSDIQAEDVSQPCYIEILEGNAVDAEGAPVNGAMLMFEVKS